MNDLAKVPEKKGRLGMRTQIFAWLAVFCLFAIALLWLTQTVFLGQFYRAVMTRKLESSASTVAADAGKLSGDALTSAVYDLSEQTGFCVALYDIRGGQGERTVSAHVNNDCLIHNLHSPTQLNDLYAGAEENGGNYLRRFDHGRPTDEDGDSVVLARIVSVGDHEVMILVNAGIAPVDATVSTLRIQLVCITAVLLVASAILAVLISRRLSKPVAAMNEKAKLLASGDYNADFTTSGCREVRELGDTLNYAAGELGKVDRMQKELIANISHDLRTPLTMISGYSEVMRDIPDEMTPENIQIIIDETARLTSLVNDTLDLSRITSGQLEMKPERFDLTALVSETMYRYAHLRERDGYVFDCRADTPAAVYADRTRISQVLCNLINNAVNYTGEDKKVTVAVTVAADTVRVTVTDTGEGIAPEKMALIWERYYKASEYHRRGAVGTGLGLSIVKGILDSIGAAYGVTSKVGEGSSFWFELPIDAGT